MGRKYSALVVMGLILLLSLFVPMLNFGKKDIRDTPRYGGVFRVKSFAESFRMQLDPANPESFIFISEQIYDGLVRLDRNFKIVPSLAEYWEISPDGKKHTFYLRKGVMFHDERELSAEDVKFSFERLLDEETNSPYYQFFLLRVVGAEDFRAGRVKEVRGFKVLDKYTFEILWRKPFVSALYLMSMHFCKILPKDIVLDRGRSFFRRPIGTGPFVFEYYVRDTKLREVGVRLKRNEGYFGGRPYLEAVEFCPQFTLDHFFNRQIDSVPVLTDRLLKSNYQIFQDGLLKPVFLGMSCHIAPFDRAIVRRAVSLGIGKRDIIQGIDDVRYYCQVTNSFIPPRLPGFFPKYDVDTHDLNRAMQLLEEAGFSEETKFPPVTFFLDFPRTDFKMKIYRKIEEQLDALGIDLRLDFYRSLEEVRGSKRPYMILVGRLMNFPDPEDVIRPLFFSESISNVFGYMNNRLDNLLQRAEVEHSWTERINLFRQIEQILISDVPAVPLFSQQNRVAMQPYVKGVKVPPLGFYYLAVRKIWLDK